ncbi:MAG: glycosyltransferase [Prochlorococcus marinus XMU1422]|nr:glycosyltransferase [Prochlorococcus marinus XMU1422]
MISSSSALGGGTKHMFSLGDSLKKEFKVCYALPLNNHFNKYLNAKNHIYINERKLDLRDIIKLLIFVNSESIDIIHAHGKGAGVIGRFVSFFSKKPIIYTFHGIHLKCHSWYKRLIYIIYEFLLGWIDSKKVLVSKSEKFYARKSKIFLGNKSIIINNGVSNMSLKKIDQIDKKQNLSRNETKINVISVCRFVKQKNIKDIVLIAKELSHIQFSIIGDGPLWKEINLLIVEKKINNIMMLGKKNNIFKYLYSADIYLSTSLYEGLPISILEAMSIGLPIVASNVIGNCDTIENEKSGFLYDLSDINNAVDFLEKLSSCKSLRKKMGIQAFQRQRKLFSKNIMLNSYKKLYKKEYLKHLENKNI